MANQVGSARVVGRDKLIARLWKQLGTKSVRFTAERRIGKTTVMNKMKDESIDGMHVIYLDLEKVASVDQFAEALVSEFGSVLTRMQKTKKNFEGLLDRIQGTEIGGIIKIPASTSTNWQRILEETLNWACENNDQTLVLMFDELPYMLQKMIADDDSDQNQALHLLDTLRALRDTHKNDLRMVFAGSVGLHHVLKALQNEEIPSQPFNDMPMVEILPLVLDDAHTLAARLIDEEQVNMADGQKAKVVREICKHTDCVPFYIEKVVARLSEEEAPVWGEDIEPLVLGQLTDDRDSWEMEHFRSRLKIYYPHRVKDAHGKTLASHIITTHILNLISVASNPLSINEIIDGIKSHIAFDDRGTVIELLRLLSRDHYLMCCTEKKYSFRFDLVRTWWVKAQGLI